MRFVKGNDIKITWSINKIVDGVTVPENLTQVQNIELKVNRGGLITTIDNYTITGDNSNNISFSIKGRDQKIGMYGLEITYFKDYDARITKSNAFMIVDDTAQLGSSSSADLQVNTLGFQTALIINGIYYTEDDLKRLIQSIIQTS